MGKMTFTPELLDSSGELEEMNLTLLTGTIGDYLSEGIDRVIDYEVDYYAEMTGEDVDHSWVEAITWDYDKMYKGLAEYLPELLAQEFPELFTTDDEATDRPVYLGKVTYVNPRDTFGWGREVITINYRVNGEALALEASGQGVTEIEDGEGISGFVRTADDKYWAQLQVIQDTLKAMDTSESIHHGLMEATGDSNGEISECMDLGELGARNSEI